MLAGDAHAQDSGPKAKPQWRVGVHYPADVLAGAVMGIALAQLTTLAGARRRPARTA